MRAWSQALTALIRVAEAGLGVDGEVQLVARPPALAAGVVPESGAVAQLGGRRGKQRGNEHQDHQGDGHCWGRRPLQNNAAGRAGGVLSVREETISCLRLSGRVNHLTRVSNYSRI